ncbi:MAG: S1C family serine protease [Proteobacteria bacterium]|nr:S1C family serine protease [Pseudomonadota bacterium]MDA1058604.1 S1C family serine protease [Pseudomonadota bacterium]
MTRNVTPRFAWLSAVIVALAVAAMAPPRAMAQERTSSADILDAVVRLESRIPRDAATASGLGTHRSGHGIVIDDNGLILTIGYLILEATEIELHANDGRTVGAEYVAYDYDTGFGLVRALTPLGIRPLRMGASGDLAERDRVLVVGSGGADKVLGAIVVERRVFTGFWEYMVDNAIFTSPPHDDWGGAALVNDRGELVGVGSLFVRNARGGNVNLPGNMFVPTDLLKPVLADMLTDGRGPGSDRPWLGIFSQELRNVVVITSMWVNGPAAKAGLKPGDMIIGIGEARVRTQEEFYRTMWSLGGAGSDVPVKVLRDGQSIDFVVKSGSRYDFLKIGGDSL